MTLKRLLSTCALTTIASVAAGSVQAAQDSGTPSSAARSSAEVARELADPNTSLAFLAFPLDYTSFKGDLRRADSQSAFKLSFQPSIPYPLGDKSDRTNFFLRPLIPIFFDQPIFSAEEQDFEDSNVELGDIAFDAAIGKTFENGIRLIGGMAGTMDTATDDDLGLDQWLLGPELFVGLGGKWGLVGLLLSHQWDVAGTDDYDTSITAGQYFYTYNLKNAWQIQAQPTFSYNHEADGGDKWTFPLGFGVAKTTKIGQVPVKFSVQFWHFVAQPDTFGPGWQIRFQVAPVIPLPW